MTKVREMLVLAAATAALGGLASCTRISVAPTCPDELLLGTVGEVRANQLQPGAIAKYQWEVVPANAGTFGDATLATTTFEALQPGEAVLRITATDGIFQVTSQCTTLIVTTTPTDDTPPDDGARPPRGGR